MRARVGVVGAGWWSTRVHLPSLASYDRAELVGVADLHADRAQRAVERFGGSAFASLSQMLEVGLDAVVIATTHDSHYELTEEALSAGLDVLVEKPMVIDPAQGFELLSLANRVGCRLHVGYPYPHSDHAKKAKALVESGSLGNLHLISSMFATPAGILYHDAERFETPEDALLGPDPATYRDIHTGGQARGQMTHSISAMLHVTGVTPIEILAYTREADVGVDMFDAACFETSEGAIGTLASTGSVPIGIQPMERLEVYGSAGHLQWGMSAGTLSLQSLDTDISAESLEGRDRYPEHMPVRHLVDCFLDEAKPLVDGRLGAMTAAVIDALLRSSRTGTAGPIDLEKG